MNSKIYLHIPKPEELWYRRKLMEDSATMSYNRGYESFPGYDRETGCIEFPEEAWGDWYEYFVGNEPERFYAYIVRKEDDVFIGEVNLHKSHRDDFHEMGIVLEAKYRGQGYSEEALKELVRYGFEQMRIEEIHNSFEVERAAALRTHLAVGFRETDRQGNVVELVIRRTESVTG